MSEWEPGEYDADPMTNAVLNVARELAGLSAATRGLLYGMKYSKDQGTSIAEAIENAGTAIADAMGPSNLSDGARIADAIDRTAETLERISAEVSR